MRCMCDEIWGILGNSNKIHAYSLYLNIFQVVLVRKEKAQHDYTRIYILFLRLPLDSILCFMYLNLMDDYVTF